MSMDSLTFFIGFTPSCNKDVYTTSILGGYSSKKEAEEWLTQWICTAIDDRSSLRLFRAETYETNYVIDTSKLDYHYIQQYVFMDLDEKDYEAIIGHEFNCLQCRQKPSFWIIGTNERRPGVVRRDLESLIV